MPTAAPAPVPATEEDRRAAEEGIELSIGGRSRELVDAIKDQNKETQDRDGVIIKYLSDWKYLPRVIEILQRDNDIRLRFKESDLAAAGTREIPITNPDGSPGTKTMNMRQFVVHMQDLPVNESINLIKGILGDRADAIFKCYEKEAPSPGTPGRKGIDMADAHKIGVAEVMDIRRQNSADVDWDRLENKLREKIKTVAESGTKHDIAVWSSNTTHDELANRMKKIFDEIAADPDREAEKRVLADYMRVWSNPNLPGPKAPEEERSAMEFHEYANHTRETLEREKEVLRIRTGEWKAAFEAARLERESKLGEASALGAQMIDEVGAAKDRAKLLAEAETNITSARKKDDSPEMTAAIPDEAKRKAFVQKQNDFEKDYHEYMSTKQLADQLSQALEQRREALKDLLQKEAEFKPDEARMKSKHPKDKDYQSAVKKQLRQFANAKRELEEFVSNQEPELEKLNRKLHDADTNLQITRGAYEKFVTEQLTPDEQDRLRAINESFKRAKIEAGEAAKTAADLERSFTTRIDGLNKAAGTLASEMGKLHRQHENGKELTLLLETSRSVYDEAAEARLTELRTTLKSVLYPEPRRTP